jgi:soluble lytic murein transglycosylase-like protein
VATTPYRSNIEFAAKQHGIDPDLLEALVLTESSGRADAFRYEKGFYDKYLKNKPEWEDQIPRRIASSYGLCQILLPTARQYGFRHEPEMLFLPDLNLDLGAKILKRLLLKFNGNVEKALQAYNGGPGNVGSPATKVYSEKVLFNLHNRVRV